MGVGEGSKTSNARLTAHYIEGIGAVASGQHRMMDVEFGTSKCRINGSTRDCSQETTSRTLSTVVAYTCKSRWASYRTRAPFYDSGQRAVCRVTRTTG